MPCRHLEFQLTGTLAQPSALESVSNRAWEPTSRGNESKSSRHWLVQTAMLRSSCGQPFPNSEHVALSDSSCHQLLLLCRVKINIMRDLEDSGSGGSSNKFKGGVDQGIVEETAVEQIRRCNAHRHGRV